ncbi:PKD domain-containing protein [Streptomyces sp. NBC_01477]|uniref:PKD domain-containing protein n=1 Tax=Streptomyces sp. NBC_01477 TaxID=2976015 RepID=UPI002E2FC505|nr:PKD domain-containing protein [Streptomyces sp. NBC_01477]
MALVGGSLSLASSAAASADGSTLYVNRVSTCSDTAEDRGTQARPFCTIQPAVDAAQPGQTVAVAASSSYTGPIVLPRSGEPGAPITLQGNVSRAVSGAYPVVTSTTATGLTGDHVHDVVVRGFIFRGDRQGAVLTDSTAVTLDNNMFEKATATTGYAPTDNGITIEGASAGVTLSRNMIREFPAAGVSLGPGVTGTIVTANVVQYNHGRGIVAVDAPDTVVTGNTISLNCRSGLVLDGSSSHAAVENNIIAYDDVLGSATTATPACTAQDQPEVSVSAGSAVGSTLAYDIVHPYGTAQPYSWAGTQYADAASLLTGTDQGRHELNTDPGASMFPTSRSPAIDSADAGAIGELTTDFQGRPRVDDPLVDNSGTGDGGYVDRGAYEYQDPFGLNGLNSDVTKAPALAPFTFTTQVNNPWNDTATYSFDFGDGSVEQPATTPTAQHAYTATGTYTVTLTATTASGVTRSSTTTVTVNPPGPLTPYLLVESGITDEPLHVQTTFDGHTDPWPVTAGKLDFGDGTTETQVLGTIQHDYQKPGTYTVIGTLSDAGGRTATVSKQVSVGGLLVPVTKTRILDTRSGVGAPKAALSAGHVLTLQVAGAGGVPRDGTTAVVLNVTETGAANAGSITVYPGGDGGKAPGTSNLNYKAGQITQNLVTVPLGPDGTVNLIASAGSVNLLADVQGYYTTDGTTPGAGYLDVADPVRVLDTRSGAAKAKVGSGRTLTLDLSKNVNGESAVLLHVTATDTTANTYVSSYTTGSSRPDVSDLNLGSGETVSNLVVVQPNSHHQVTFFNHAGSTDLVVDLVGMFGPPDIPTGNGSYVALAPHRLLDTRYVTGAPVAKVGPGGELTVKVAGQGGVPANAAFVLINLTGTNATAGTYVTAYMPGSARPVSSSLNVAQGAIVPNLALVRVSSAGYITLYNHAGTIDLVADIEGFYTRSQF